MPRCNSPELLDPADESLDRTALPACLAVKPALLVPAGLRRNDRGRSGRRNHVEDGVAVAIPVADHRLVRPEPLKKRPRLRAVGRLSRCQEHDLHQRVAVDADVDLRGPAAAAQPDLGRLAVPWGARAVLVDADRRGIHHAQAKLPAAAVAVVVVAFRKFLKFRHYLLPEAVPAPPVVPVEAGRVGTVALRQVAPRRAGAQHEEDAVHHPPVMHPLRALMLLRKHGAENFPLRIRHVVSVAAHASNSLSGLFPAGITEARECQMFWVQCLTRGVTRRRLPPLQQ